MCFIWPTSCKPLYQNVLSFQLFLDPLGQAVGSTKSKQLLLQMCSSVHDMNRLLELGCLLGISEWSNVITPKCRLPESTVQILTPDVGEFFEEDEVYIYNWEGEGIALDKMICIFLDDNLSKHQWIFTKFVH